MLLPNWATIGQADFDRIVEILAYRLYPNVYAVDGRGGDQGIDIRVEGEQGLEILQLKYFPDGFSAERRSRRRQIKHSFDRAMQQQPTKWTLVVPSKLTNGERLFVRKLGKGKDVQIAVMDARSLDSELSRHPDLVEHIATDDLLISRAVVLNRERDVLLDGVRDFAARQRALQRVMDAVDPHWTVVPTTFAGRPANMVVPKHEQSAKVSPIGLSISAFDLSQNADWSKVVGFGLQGEATLAATDIAEFSFEGPDWLKPKDGILSLTVANTEKRTFGHRTLKLAISTVAGEQVFHETADTQVGSGVEGIGIQGNFYGCLRVTLKLPPRTGLPGNCDMSLDTSGKFPCDILRGIALWRSLHASHAVTLQAGELHLGELHIAAAAAFPESLATFESVVEDLAITQEHAGVSFVMPNRITRLERASLRWARLMIEGGVPRIPAAHTMTLTLSEEADESLMDMLEEGGSMMSTAEYSLTVDGHEFSIGEVHSVGVGVLPENGEEVREYIRKGQHAGKVLRLSAASGECFRSFMPDKRPDPDLPLTVTAWGLAGYADLEGTAQGSA